MVRHPLQHPALRLPILTAAMGLGLCGTALAHAHLDFATPPVDGTLRSAPQQVQIGFTEALEPALSSLSVHNAAGDRVDSGHATVSANDRRVLEVGLPQPLAAGSYTVRWAITSVDTHRTEGDYRFTVQP